MVQKIILREEVIKFLKPILQSNDHSCQGLQGAQLLIQLWSTILGIDPSILKAETNICEFADSLILPRFSSNLRRNGHHLSLEQLIANSTIGTQAKILSS
jgi:aryl carrier-like protein